MSSSSVSGSSPSHARSAAAGASQPAPLQSSSDVLTDLGEGASSGTNAGLAEQSGMSLPAVGALGPRRRESASGENYPHAQAPNIEDLSDQQIEAIWNMSRARSESVESVGSQASLDDSRMPVPAPRRDLVPLLQLMDNLHAGVVNDEDAAKRALEAVRALSPQTRELLNQLREPIHDPESPLARSIASKSPGSARTWSREGKKSAAGSRSPTPLAIPGTPSSERGPFFPSAPSSRSDSRASPSKSPRVKDARSPRLVDDKAPFSPRRFDNKLTEESLDRLTFEDLRKPDCVFRPAFCKQLAKQFVLENWDCLENVREFRLSYARAVAQAQVDPSSEQARMLMREALHAAKTVAHFAVGADLNVSAGVKKVMLDIDLDVPREMSDISNAIEAIHSSVYEMLAIEPVARLKKLGISGIRQLMGEG